jgi:hypothetical protein
MGEGATVREMAYNSYDCIRGVNKKFFDTIEGFGNNISDEILQKSKGSSLDFRGPTESGI